ncbi:MAG: hypothetical protein MK052_00935 [Alphaproteobacteria bacterium]|nr:hypothetical protein [Alphaproteobacteria bacterium]
MSFRTLIMLAVAALVIVVAVKMNRNPVRDNYRNTAIATTTTTPEGYVNDTTIIAQPPEEIDVVDPAINDDGVLVEDASEVFIDEDNAEFIQGDEGVDTDAPSDSNSEDGAVILEEDSADTSAQDDNAFAEDDAEFTEEDAEFTEDETEATVGEEPMSEEDAETMEPAVVEESPAETLKTGPAETISDEPITTN